MRKRWLTWCVVYLLGVSTIPGALLATRWLKSSDAEHPKFTHVVLTGASVAVADELDEPVVRADNRKTLFEELPIDTREYEPAQRSTAPKLNFEDSFAVDIKPPQRATNLDDGFDSPPLREPVTIVVPKRPPLADSKPQADVPDGIASLAETNPSDEQKAKLTSLREKLAELMKAKADLINEQTLSQEVSALEKQIFDLHAAQKLLSAQQILKALVEEFPDSPASVRAKRMLEAAGMKQSSWKSEPLRPQPEPAEALPTYR